VSTVPAEPSPQTVPTPEPTPAGLAPVEPIAAAGPAPADRTPAGSVEQPAGQASTPPATPEHRHVPLMNIANILTVSRLVMVPIFLVVLFTDGGHSFGWRLAATILFALASVTDQLDGWLARRHGLVTDFGKLVDPIADKALTGAALFGLSILGELPWWVTIVIAAREVGVTLLRFWVIRFGVIPASRGGKLKTLTQIVAIGFFLAPLSVYFDVVEWTLMGVAIALTVITGLDYVFRAFRLRATGIRTRRAAEGT
jgi:CDP-diacylglycerol--glycerol-3-phosphate 3-phosphatidyltransferase